MVASPAQFTRQERSTIRAALANNQTADRLIEKLDGTGRIGTGGSGAVVDEQSAGQVHTTKLTYTSKAIATVDGGGNGGIGNLKIYTFPEGAIKILGATVDLAFTVTSGLTNALKFSLGIIPAATTDALTLTKANVVPSTGGTITTGAGTMKGLSQNTAIVALTDGSGGTPSDSIADAPTSYTEATIANTWASFAAKINELIALMTLNGNSLAPLLDGTSAAKDLYLNIGAINANSSADATVTITGTITIAWQWVGDK